MIVRRQQLLSQNGKPSKTVISSIHYFHVITAINKSTITHPAPKMFTQCVMTNRTVVNSCCTQNTKWPICAMPGHLGNLWISPQWVPFLYACSLQWKPELWEDKNVLQSVDCSFFTISAMRFFNSLTWRMLSRHFHRQIHCNMVINISTAKRHRPLITSNERRGGQLQTRKGVTNVEVCI